MPRGIPIRARWTETHLGKRRDVRGRRAMSLLEVVAAIAIVALLCSTVLGAVSFMQSIELRQTHTLACGELANRMMLQYLDDKSALPSTLTPLEYGAHRYRWSVGESHVGFNAVEAPPTAAANAPTGRQARSTIPPERRYRMVTVTVWLSEESGGSMQLQEGIPHARFGRLIDLLAFRNPDSATNMLNQPGKMQELLEAMGGIPTGGAGGSGGTGGAGGSGTGQPGTGNVPRRPGTGGRP